MEMAMAMAMGMAMAMAMAMEVPMETKGDVNRKWLTVCFMIESKCSFCLKRKDSLSAICIFCGLIHKLDGDGDGERDGDGAN